MMLKRMKSVGLLPMVCVIVCASCTSKSFEELRPKTVDDLKVNEDAVVEWIAMERAVADAQAVLENEDATELFGIVERFVEQELGGGTLVDMQVRYRDYSESRPDDEQTPDENYNGTGLISGKDAGILRGTRADSGVVVHQLPDDSEWTEWASMPSIMGGSYLFVPTEKVDQFSELIQGWFASHYGEDFMANEGQFLVEQNERRIIIQGVCKWSPPSRHLHSIVVT